MSLPLDSLAPDQDRLHEDLSTLAAFADSTAPGWTRRVFSDPYRASREWVHTRMVDAGLDVRVDPVGNIIGTLPGTGGGKPLATGSHTDTVHGGGRFDGSIGVLGAIEMVRTLRESGIALAHDLLVVDFLGEEPNDYGVSCVGSRALAGQLGRTHLDAADEHGRRLGAALTDSGFDPAGAAVSWAPGSLAAFVELHIEQGPRLQQRDTDIGVVTAIAGIERLLATFVGRADHAGTMPMADRRDALTAAARAIITVERTACGAAPEAVATTGRIEALPGAANVVPERARIWTEMRSNDGSWLDATKRRLAEEIVTEAAAHGVQAELSWLTDQPPVPTTLSVRDAVGRSADDLGLSWIPMPSGAGHDAAHMAHLGPMGMVFVPSRDGRSHCPQEWTDLTQIARGVHTLAATLMRLDRAAPIR